MQRSDSRSDCVTGGSEKHLLEPCQATAGVWMFQALTQQGGTGAKPEKYRLNHQDEICSHCMGKEVKHSPPLADCLAHKKGE